MFYDRFKELCEQKGVSCNKAALEIGLSNATPTKWKKTGATPTGDTLRKIAEYFGVTESYLLSSGSEAAQTITAEMQFGCHDKDVQKILSVCTDLNEDGKRELLKYAEYLASKPEYKKCVDIPAKEA